MDLKARMRAIAQGLLRAQNVLEVISIDDCAFLLGVSLIGFGVAGFDRHVALIVVGVILLLSVKPLWHWIK